MKDRIDTLLHEESRFEPPAHRAGRSLVPDYEGLYRHSIADLEGYWERIAGEFAWYARSSVRSRRRRSSSSRPSCRKCARGRSCAAS
jgi:hypothetical protein